MMKNLILKSIVSGLLVLVASSVVAQEEVLPQQEAPTDQIFFERGAWKAQTVVEHNFWKEPSCMAVTVGDDNISTLEVVSFADGQGGYTEPVIQVLGPVGIFFEVTAETDGRSSIYEMMPLYDEAKSADLVASVAKVEDRSSLIDSIERKNRLVAKYYDAVGLVNTVTFSLRGSSATVSAMFKTCAPGVPAQGAFVDVR